MYNVFYSELHYIEEFLPERLQTGIEGYLLTQFQIAARFLKDIHIPLELLEKNREAINEAKQEIASTTVEVQTEEMDKEEGEPDIRRSSVKDLIKFYATNSTTETPEK